MSDDLSKFLATRPASAERPLLGLTVLLVEDSRFASEAVRLLCLRSGARIRRADCLRSAHRHLATYRPGVVIVDMGLPDGSGADLIHQIKQGGHGAPAVLGLSGDPGKEAEALAAGADAFMPKPLESLAMFQQAVLSVLPPEERPLGLRVVDDETVSPDPLALRDDLSHVAEVLAAGPDSAALDYVAHFLTGIARSSHDEDLEAAAEALGDQRRSRDITKLTGLVQARLAAASGF
ncbi:response regulator receiver domain-containing protein [Rhodobacter aestuarii]|uniref:Response regulator receiver domain-containing protein n=1 Tax=Rhodobacter aestuarii TaxID=453582 RepID=A0A1N7NE57_9RHOB|nr:MULTISPECIES: response regulator [Rhodobacter]PTV96408.1 response regulator receiver domain-containing protein [Rhodobacter aestuarii]SIS96634.1 Response regulator receiver domain-containing protein [Rhodobacter aestuarii]SOB92326.1 response regulator receiver domain-containing protein [Rhodobacter sp. JA431]